MSTFYLHEDDWGMINLLPAENAVWAEGVAQEAQQAARDNFAGYVEMGGGQIPTYNNIYVIPEEKHPISERGIALDELRALLDRHWPQAEKVQSGYSSHTEDIKGAFAFGESSGDGGAFYGSHNMGKVTSLHILRPDNENIELISRFGAALEHLGKQYNLMLVDWWSDTVLNLRDTENIRRYLAGGPWQSSNY